MQTSRSFLGTVFGAGVFGGRCQGGYEGSKRALHCWSASVLKLLAAACTPMLDAVAWSHTNELLGEAS